LTARNHLRIGMKTCTTAPLEDPRDAATVGLLLAGFDQEAASWKN
jgi:hypothetical protein